MWYLVWLLLASFSVYLAVRLSLSTRIEDE